MTAVPDLRERVAELEQERNQARAALERVEDQCATWDRLTKGETATTAAIRRAMRGDTT